MAGADKEAVRRAEERIGRVLRDKWRLDRVLGVGGYGAVYAATHRAGKRVAIKLLHPVLSIDPEIRSRFLREAYVANMVEHPGAVSVLDDDVDEEEEAAFLVMDLLVGETLEARRKRKGGTLPANEVLSIADQVLDVLITAHAKGIIHRDVKPDNLFLSRDGRVNLLDFGVARLREVSSERQVTQTGAVMGTPAFMAPEQARGRWELVDERTDLWSLGATMFALLCGRMVHGDLTGPETLVASMTRPAPSVASLKPDLPDEIVKVVDQALAFEQEKRWPDAKSMQQAVRRAYYATMGSSVVPELRVSVPQEVEPPTPVQRRSDSLGSAPSPASSTLATPTSQRTGAQVTGVPVSTEGRKSGAAPLAVRRRTSLWVMAALGSLLLMAGALFSLGWLFGASAPINGSATVSAQPPELTSSAVVAPVVASTSASTSAPQPSASAPLRPPSPLPGGHRDPYERRK